MRPFAEVFVVEFSDQGQNLFAHDFQFSRVPDQLGEKSASRPLAESSMNGMHDLIIIVGEGSKLVKEIVQPAVKLDGGTVDANHFQLVSEQSGDDEPGFRTLSSGLGHHLQQPVLLFGIELEIVAINLPGGYFRPSRFLLCAHKKDFIQGETTSEFHTRGTAGIFVCRKYFRHTKVQLAVGWRRQNPVSDRIRSVPELRSRASHRAVRLQAQC